MQDKVVLGHMIKLPVVDLTDQGAFVDAQEEGSLFVPKKQLPDDLKIGDLLRVFLYKDAGRVLATARHPYLECGMIGNLTVTSIDCGTVYMDLGIPKELVVPISEQRTAFEVGESVTILVALDDQGRLFGTQRFNHYISDTAKPGKYKPGQRVNVVAVSHTPLGFRVVVNDEVYGLLYKSELKGVGVKIGKRTTGYITKVREDGRLDVSFQEIGVRGIEHASKLLLKILKAQEGFLQFNDKSDPQDIEDYLHMSKGKFKKALGGLYKNRLITIEEEGIRLTQAGIDYKDN